MLYRLVFLFAVLVFKRSHAICLGAGEENWGSCPNIEPMSKFNMNEFLGHWYVIQATDAWLNSPSPCLSYYIASHPRREGRYTLAKYKQAQNMFEEIMYGSSMVGELSVPNQYLPGRMELEVFPPYSIFTTMVTVFTTDYDNYAAILICKQCTSWVHRWSVQILSRTHSLDLDIVNKIRTRLYYSRINTASLKTVSYKMCPEIESATKQPRKVPNPVEVRINIAPGIDVNSISEGNSTIIGDTIYINV